MESDASSSMADESDHQHDDHGLGDGDDDGRRGEALPRSLCCRELQLLEFPDKFVLRSVDPLVPDRAFSVSRSDGQLQSLSSVDAGDLSSLNPSKVSTVYGVLGIISFFAGTYVLVITSRKEVGSYFGYTVYLVQGMRFLDYNRASRFSTSQQKRDEAYFMSLLRTLESTPGLYYSYERDLTLNLQRSCMMTKERSHKPLWKQADPRFVWNHNMLEELIENKLDTFIIPVIQGNILNSCNSHLELPEEHMCMP